jgi:hypothetical protein
MLPCFVFQTARSVAREVAAGLLGMNGSREHQVDLAEFSTIHALCHRATSARLQATINAP